MIYSHIKIVVVHIMMLKVIDDFLKYSFHISISQVKILKLLLNYQYQKMHISSMDYLLDSGYVNSKISLLQMLNDLNNRNLLTKIKDINDQRKLSILLSNAQIQRIEYLLKEIDDYLAHHFKHYFFQSVTDRVKYLIKSHQTIKKLSEYLALGDLTIEEIYVLGILSLHDHRLTIKELQYEQQHQFMIVSPIIKKLIEKNLVSKTRISHDERCVAIQITKDKRSKIYKLIEVCYNFLEKGIKDNN